MFLKNSDQLHVDSSCERLQLNFRYFELPEEIKAKGEDEIKLSRKRFKENRYLLDKPDIFAMRFQAR